MLTLGLSGGLDLDHRSKVALTTELNHDAAAVLIENGNILAAVEEERLNRIKHTNRFPSQSVRLCLQARSVGLQDVDSIAIYSTEEYLRYLFKSTSLNNFECRVVLDVREAYQDALTEATGYRPPANKLHFVQHHHAHAVSAFALSGFERSLVLTVDGCGEGLSTTVVSADDDSYEVLTQKGLRDSIGAYYVEVIKFLGYSLFDEYKVMGLAPYGDPNRLSSLFATFYTLLPEGDYQIHRERVIRLYDVVKPRRRPEPITQLHKDIAAALQQSVENIVLHVLTHYRESTDCECLCLSGGVAQNSRMNGRILSSGL